MLTATWRQSTSTSLAPLSSRWGGERRDSLSRLLVPKGCIAGLSAQGLRPYPRLRPATETVPDSQQRG